nr:hypothetical protein [Tanacetum cinerariifolium]
SSKASGCSHKMFMSGKPHPFNGTEGVVRLTQWIEKVEQVFETCKCAEEDKVMYAANTFEGRALTWWNGNLKTLGLKNANKIPWDEFKTMLTTEMVPTEKKKIKSYIKGFPDRNKGNLTSSRLASLHEVIEMARELVEQSIQSKAARANDGGKRKWDDNRRGTLPYCSKCDWHHTGACAKLCKRCKKHGHEEKECRFRPTNGNPREVECWECGAKGHTKNR